MGYKKIQDHLDDYFDNMKKKIAKEYEKDGIEGDFEMDLNISTTKKIRKLSNHLCDRLSEI